MTQVFTPTRPVPPLPGTALLGLSARSLLELDAQMCQGFPAVTVSRLADHLGLPLAQVLALLELSPAAYHRRRRQGRPLSREHSRALWALGRATEAAEAYFGSAEAAHRWLATPRATLAGWSPLRLALAPSGVEHLQTLLSRLEHGVFS